MICYPLSFNNNNTKRTATPIKQSKSDGYIGPVEPLATSLQRANKASVEQAISGELFSATGARRFARGIRVAQNPPPPIPENQPSTSAADAAAAPAASALSSAAVSSADGSEAVPSIAPKCRGGD